MASAEARRAVVEDLRSKRPETRINTGYPFPESETCIPEIRENFFSELGNPVPKKNAKIGNISFSQ